MPALPPVLLLSALPGLNFDLPTAGALTDYFWFAPFGELFLVCLGITIVLFGAVYTVLKQTTLLATSPGVTTQGTDFAILFVCIVLVFGCWGVIQLGKKEARRTLHDSVVYLLRANGWEQISFKQIRQQFGMSDPTMRTTVSAINLSDTRTDRLLLEMGQDNNDKDLQLIAFDRETLGLRLGDSSLVRDALCADLYRCCARIVQRYRSTSLPLASVYFGTISSVLASDKSPTFLASALSAYPTIFKPQRDKYQNIVSVDIDAKRWDEAIQRAVADKAKSLASPTGIPAGLGSTAAVRSMTEQDTIDCIREMMPPRLNRLRNPAILKELVAYSQQELTRQATTAAAPPVKKQPGTDSIKAPKPNAPAPLTKRTETNKAAQQGGQP
ncbi:hypothetical protein [Hymenobacter chitinivorans]|uniref:Uncharacterized protein n=1 Tax=Hymenobacter chitinivorans DSM 11115 TaxID=1121954 RepID=A0A2M9AS63_9BACT|nr:hypothetical protein [Hymenobacter chitinivorans]PJJ48542.1 hypothetical protein CLV45_4251 [Hymenobacter chitinivorans DSM 11115]